MEATNFGAMIIFGTLLLITIGSIIYLQMTEFKKQKPTTN